MVIVFLLASGPIVVAYHQAFAYSSGFHGHRYFHPTFYNHRYVSHGSVGFYGHRYFHPGGYHGYFVHAHFVFYRYYIHGTYAYYVGPGGIGTVKYHNLGQLPIDLRYLLTAFPKFSSVP